MLIITFQLLAITVLTTCNNFSNINLPTSHLPYYFSNYPDVATQCSIDPECPFNSFVNTPGCWGYESDCKSNRFSTPKCPGDHKGWVKTKADQIDTFNFQTDFGYIKQQIKEFKMLCVPFFVDDSSLECSSHLRFCRGRNIMLNFTDLRRREEPIRYKMDVLKEGQVGGYCDVKATEIENESDHLSALQSWGPELRNFRRLKRRPIPEGDCDVIIEKPTFIMKIDATVNMYHHFCDFVNLYASLHTNSSHSDAFSTDIHILVWETYTYRSAFQTTFDAFTRHPIWDLKTFRGETVCFKNIVFPLLPRMIFGLYYNTPIIYGCERSGLFRAFSEHVLHRLNVDFYKRKNRKVRITLLVRDTKHRRILNENELLAALSNIDDYEVRKEIFNNDIPFKKQLEITRNSDVFIGIHGAGLTHLLFLPNWASIFELYNCEDASCYKDLARLRGVKYVTWEKSDKLYPEKDESYDGGAHAKFANYAFDKTEFLRLVAKAVKYVRSHPEFRKMLDGAFETNTNHDEL